MTVNEFIQKIKDENPNGILNKDLNEYALSYNNIYAAETNDRPMTFSAARSWAEIRFQEFKEILNKNNINIIE